MTRMILVTGATGKQGGAVADQLLKDGWMVRALTRKPEREEAIALDGKGAQIIKGDLDEPMSLRTALHGVYGVFSVQDSWEHGVEKEITQGKRLADEAKHCGVNHFIYSSVGCAHRNTGIPHFESKWEIEKHIRSLGIKHTILRPAFFMENFLEPEMKREIKSGSLPLGLYPERSLQMIAVKDIGVFTTIAFDNPDDYIGREMDIAGDECTGPRMAEILGSTIGREVIYRQTPMESLKNRGQEMYSMYDWFNKKGYEADIKALRKIYPELMSFERWTKENNRIFERQLLQV